MSEVRIALLRGINLVKRNRVSMPELRASLADAGYGEVRTLLQSGNLVLRSRKKPATLETELSAHVADRHGVDCAVVVRTREELAEAVERDPFAKVAKDPKRYQVSFLSAEPDADVVAGLAERDVEPDRWTVIGRELYVWHAGGIQKSPAARLLTDKRLGVVATARNWSTVGKLLELADELAS